MGYLSWRSLLSTHTSVPGMADVQGFGARVTSCTVGLVKLCVISEWAPRFISILPRAFHFHKPQIPERM